MFEIKNSRQDGGWANSIFWDKKKEISKDRKLLYMGNHGCRTKIDFPFVNYVCKAEISFNFEEQNNIIQELLDEQRIEDVHHEPEEINHIIFE